MQIDAVKRLYRAAPFRPFGIVLNDGSAVHVAHPEFISFSPDGHTIQVWNPNGGQSRIDVDLISALAPSGPPRGTPLTIDDIRAYRNANPFLPFEILLLDGRVVFVEFPFRIAIAPWGRFAVFVKSTPHRFGIADVIGVRPAALEATA